MAKKKRVLTVRYKEALGYKEALYGSISRIFQLTKHSLDTKTMGIHHISPLIFCRLTTSFRALRHHGGCLSYGWEETL